MTIKYKKRIKFAGVVLAIASVFGITTPLFLKHTHPEQISSVNNDGILSANARTTNSSIETVELSTADYTVEMIKDEMVSTPISTSNQFSLKNLTTGNKRFWELWFQNGAAGHEPCLDFFNKEYQFEAANLITNQRVSSQNYNEASENIMTYTLYDTSLNEIPSVLSEGEYTSQNGKYGLNFSTEQSSFFPNKSLSKQYPIMYVGAKFWYNDAGLKPIPVSENINGFDNEYIYDLKSENTWISTGYFVYEANEQNKLNYYMPQKSQDTSEENNTDFYVEIQEDKIDKTLTAKQFYDIHKDNLKEIIALKIKNGIPGITGNMSLDINTQDGYIDIYYTPSHFVAVEEIEPGVIVQSDFIPGKRIKVGRIGDFYTNTTRNDYTFDADIGNIGQSKSPGEITLNEAKTRAQYYINDIWEQPYSDMKVVGQSESETDLIADNSTSLIFKCRPNKVIQNGEIVNVTNDAYDVIIKFTGFKELQATDIIALETPLNQDIIPRDLQSYFDEVKNDKIALKERLLEFARITGEESDIPEVIIDSITVTEWNDNEGTATLSIEASNCRVDGAPRKTNKSFNIQLTNLKRIRETHWVDGEEFNWDYQESNPFTVEKLIYDLYNNEATKNDFILWIKDNLVEDEPRDVKISLQEPEFETDAPTVLYSNKDKYFYVKVSLDKHYAPQNISNNADGSNDIINESTDSFFKTFKINLSNAANIEGPTSINPQTITAFADQYAQEVSDEAIQQELFKYLSPEAIDGNTDDITKFPRVNRAGDTLTYENVKLRNIEKDNKNGIINLQYRLNAKYDESNYNTQWIPNDSEDGWVNLSITGLLKPKITIYDVNDDRDIALTHVSEIYAKDFSNDNDTNVLQAIIDKIKYGGNLSNGVNLTYTICQEQNLDNLYSGKLAIDINIENAWVYDVSNNTGSNKEDLYIKQENVNLGEFFLTGFKQYTQTDFKSDSETEEGIKTKTINIQDYPNDWNDTTANNIDWSVNNLQNFILNHIDIFFDNPPINQDGTSGLTAQDIIIKTPVYNAFDERGNALDNPTIEFTIGLRKYVEPVGSGFELIEGQKEYGTVTITGFRKSVATTIQLNKDISGKLNVGNLNILSQLVTGDNFKESVNNFSSTYTISNYKPSNWNEDNININVIQDSWNNSNGSVSVEYVFNNVYVDNGDNRFAPGQLTIGPVIVDGFKNVEPTTAVNNRTINISDFSNYIASELVENSNGINTIKSIIATHINQFLINYPDNFDADNLTFEITDIQPLNNNGSGFGQITISNFKVNKYYDNDEKYTLYSPDTIEREKNFGEFVITGFKRVEETSLSSNEISVNDLSDKIAQDTQSNSQTISQTIRSFIFANRSTIFNNLPNVDQYQEAWILVDYINGSWNNKNQSIKVNVTLKQYYDANGTLIKASENQPKQIENVTIKGFKNVSPTVLKSDSITIETNQVASSVTDESLRQYLVDNINELLVENSYIDNPSLPYTFSWENRENKNFVDGSDKGQIILTNLKINQWFENDEKYTFHNENYETLGNLTINGYQQISPTTLVPEITVDGLGEYFAQKNDQSIDENVRTTIINNIISNQTEYFSALPTLLTANDIEISLVEHSWNNKEGIILVNISISKFFDENGIDKTDTNSTKLFENIIINGFKCVDATNVVSTIASEGIHTNIEKYPDDPTIIDDLKNYVVSNQKSIFENLPLDYLNVNALTDQAFSVSINEYNLVDGWIDANVSLNMYYKNDERNSFIDSSEDPLNVTIRFYVNEEFTYPPSVLPDFGNPEFSESIVNESYDGIIGKDMLAQDFYQNLNTDENKNKVKQVIVNEYNKINTSFQLTTNDIDFSFDQNSINNATGSIVLASITFNPGKYIDHDGTRPDEVTTKIINKAITGFLTAEETKLKSTDGFNPSNLPGFFNEYGEKYAKMYPQQIVNLHGDEIYNDLSTWLNTNLNSLFVNNDDNENNQLHIPADKNDYNGIYELHKSTFTFKNKEGAIYFDLHIPSQYVYSGSKAIYGENDLNASIKLAIGMKVNGSTTINNMMDLNAEEIRSKLPSQYVDSTKDVAEAAKNLILDKLYVEWKQNPQEFLNRNSLLENVPITWLGDLPDTASSEDFKNQISQNINVEYVGNNDKNGTVTFKISINDGSYYFEWKGEPVNDYILSSENWSDLNNGSTQLTVNGFQKFSEFPFWAIVLGIAGLIVLMVIIILSLYYYYKKKKYTTVTVANESELR